MFLVHLKFHIETKIFKLLGRVNYNDRCDPCQDGKMSPKEHFLF